MSGDLSEIRYVERITLGNSDPNRLLSEKELEMQNESLNAALNGIPRGRILATDRNFACVSAGDHQLILQWVTYHVGYTRRPLHAQGGSYGAA